MYEHVNLADLESHDVENVDARVKAVGYELRPRKTHPSVWSFDTGRSGPMHYQREQEELYHVLSGAFELAFAGDNGEETEALDPEPDDFMVISPDEVWQLCYVETDEVFVVGAPNAKDDGVVVGRAGGSPPELVGNAMRAAL